jgi:hypothetical protein
MVQGQTILEYEADSGACNEVRKVWLKIKEQGFIK